MRFIIYLVINIGIAIYTASISFLKPNKRGGKSVFILSLASLFCYTSILQYALSPSELTKTIQTVFTFWGATLATIALFTFSLEYTFRTHWINHFTIVLLAIVPVFTQALCWASDAIILFQKDLSFFATLESPLVGKLNALYLYSLIVPTVWLLGRSSFLRLGFFNFRFLSMLTGPLISLITQGLILLGVDGNWLEEIFLLSLNLSALGFAYSVYRHSSNIELLFRREKVVENIKDGWIVLDIQNSIVDFNQATTNLIGLPLKKVSGKPITSVWSDFPDLAQMLDKSQEIEMDRIIKIYDKYRYLNFRVYILWDDVKTPVGRLVIWRDITERKRSEDAHQQARNEMFVLLNAISSAAGQTANMEEFLSDVIYQIVYPFRSQIVFFIVFDERSNSKNEEGFFLAAHLGLSTASINKVRSMFTSISLTDWLDKNKQYSLLEGSQKNLPEPMRELGMACFLAIPLRLQTGKGEKLIGALFLARKEKPKYKQDEIIRLTILADQIATLVDSDRRRKLAISLSERQRLMRDVHDSVSQKLYGLVTLTEAAQAALEAGSQMDYGQVLSRIGENARQAVKELRLFLFQMLPIDLEKEGLISALHHRLAAVEGRADIQVRFLADEQIQISKRKEVALYYIAQEALNNVLRHAHAKSVTVTLKQGYRYVTLEVSDDGCGFENERLERGGLGLNNIKERVKQEKGKLKISSKIGEGTIIKVTFEKD